MPHKRLKFRLSSETTSGRIHRSIEVHRCGSDIYQLRTLDVIGRNWKHPSQIAGDEVNGIPMTLEQANAEAKAVYRKYLADGWTDASPAV